MELGNSASPQFHDLPKRDINASVNHNGHISGMPTLSASPSSAFPDSNRRAVMFALKNLQDKIRKLEAERVFADTNLRYLEDAANRNGHSNAHSAAVSPDSVSRVTKLNFDARNEEVHAQLRFAESRCRMLETQLEYLRKVLQNTERDRVALRNSTDFANKQAGDRNAQHETSMAKNERDSAKIQADHRKIAEIEAQLREEDARRRELLEKVAALRIESEGERERSAAATTWSSTSASASSNTTASSRTQTHATAANGVERQRPSGAEHEVQSKLNGNFNPEAKQKPIADANQHTHRSNADAVGPAAAIESGQKAAPPTGAPSASALNASGGFAYSSNAERAEGAKFATNAVNVAANGHRSPLLPVDMRDKRQHEVHIQEHLHVDYDVATRVPRAAVYDMRSLCMPVDEGVAATQSNTQKSTQDAFVAHESSAQMRTSLGRVQRESHTKPRRLETEPQTFALAANASDSSPTTTNDDERHSLRTRFDLLPSRPILRPRDHELPRSHSRSTSAERSRSASRSPPFVTVTEDRLSREVRRVLASPTPRVSVLSPPRRTTSPDLSPLGSGTREQYNYSHETLKRRNFDAQIERARERERQLDAELRRIRERERERSWRTMLDRDGQLLAFNQPSADLVLTPGTLNASDYSALLSLLRDVELELTHLTDARRDTLARLEKSSSSSTGVQLLAELDRLEVRAEARRKQAESLRRYLQLRFDPIDPHAHPLPSNHASASRTRSRQYHVDVDIDAPAARDGDDEHDDDGTPNDPEDNGRVQIVTTVRARGRRASPIRVSDSADAPEGRDSSRTRSAAQPRKTQHDASTRRSTTRLPHYSTTTASFRQKRSMPRAPLAASLGLPGSQQSQGLARTRSSGGAPHRSAGSVGLGVTHARLYNASSTWH